jgi:hypothetical protein
MQALSRGQQFGLFVFLALWAFFGLTGRDAWKAEEALALAPVLDWLATGGLPSGSATPFHTLLAGLAARLAGPWLDVQDGARLASGLLTLLALAFTGLAARRLHGPGFGAAAALALLGCFGLLLRAHALLPETALLMGYALLLHGVALARQDAGRGALALAAGAAVAVLSRGVPDLLAVLLIALLPLAAREWRTRAYRRAVLGGLAGLALLLLLWIGLLAAQGGEAVGTWWGNFLAAWRPVRTPGAILELLSWFAWPAWPLAAWAVWHEHRRLRRATNLHPPLIALAITLALAHWPTHSSGGGALPVLVPLALLAAHGVANLRRGAAQAFYWFGVVCFLFFALAFWLYFAALEWGWPADMAARMLKLVPNYAGGQTPSHMLALAAAATLAWLVAIPLFPRAKARPVLVWATGMALLWFLLIGLLRPWAEAGWAYRPLIREMAAHLPADACLRADVDPDMHAMLRLHLAGRFRAAGTCRYWLVQADRRAIQAADWPVSLVWHGYRTRDRSQVFRLYRRGDD